MPFRSRNDYATKRSEVILFNNLYATKSVYDGHNLAPRGMVRYALQVSFTTLEMFNHRELTTGRSFPRKALKEHETNKVGWD